MARKQVRNRDEFAAHQEFSSYAQKMASHPAYRGMPDAFGAAGDVQWEAPSNRKAGRYKDTHHKRRDWWRRKAIELGIDVTKGQWISQAAKRLHPLKAKPCKRCGRVMELSYVYPQERLLERFRRLAGLPDTVVLDRLEPVDRLVARLVKEVGRQVLDVLPEVLATGEISPPAIGRDLSAWTKWLREAYVPREPRLLSPGAMSNAPDRFDGFHSFNLCCRSKADTGRHVGNLKSYVTDRRVFEFWNAGDWIAADRLMGQIRRGVKGARCINGHAGSCTADHIGPLSLGFTHRPVFQLMCRPCNSAKNNRLTHRDVLTLLAAEGSGDEVISWHSRAIWDRGKVKVQDDETALRLSKLLRDNRHTVMSILGRLRDAGQFAFLASLLELDRADETLKITELVATGGIIAIKDATRSRRVTRYAEEQKGRRLRVALQSLVTYGEKATRNALVIDTPAFEKEVRLALQALEDRRRDTKLVDERIRRVLSSGGGEAEFRGLVHGLGALDDPAFRKAKVHLERALASSADALIGCWDDERYIRTERWDVDETPSASPTSRKPSRKRSK